MNTVKEVLEQLASEIRDMHPKASKDGIAAHVELRAKELTTPGNADTGEAWVRCSERLPTEADGDDNGEVWWVTPNEKGEMTVISMNWSFGAPSDRGITLLDEATHWKPTGLKRPTPPTAQGGE